MPDNEKTSDSTRGRLKVFLGYASGVGKSFRMFDEGRRRRSRGADVVVVAIQATEPAVVQQLLCDLEVIPPRVVDGVPAIDVEQVLRRRPAVCLIDGLAYRIPRAVNIRNAGRMWRNCSPQAFAW